MEDPNSIEEEESGPSVHGNHMDGIIQQSGNYPSLSVAPCDLVNGLVQETQLI